MGGLYARTLNHWKLFSNVSLPDSLVACQYLESAQADCFPDVL